MTVPIPGGLNTGVKNENRQRSFRLRRGHGAPVRGSHAAGFARALAPCFPDPICPVGAGPSQRATGVGTYGRRNPVGLVA